MNWRKSELVLFIVVANSAVQIAFSAYHSPSRCSDDTVSKTLTNDNSISFVDLAEQFVGDIHHYRPTAKMHSARKKNEYRTSKETIFRNYILAILGIIVVIQFLKSIYSGIVLLRRLSFWCLFEQMLLCLQKRKYSCWWTHKR